MPLSVPGAAALREAMISAAPSNMQVPATWANTVAAKAFSMVSLYGQAPARVCQGLERQGLASCRYQDAGSREIIAIDANSILEFAGKLAVDKKVTLAFSQLADVFIQARV